jgi:hypothetical protein
VQDQYTADVNDYFKYSLLRAIQARRPGPLAVCWMLVPDDGGEDGRKLGYLDQEERYRPIDGPLFDALRDLVANERRTTARVEAADLLPRAIYCRKVIPRPAADRAAVMESFLVDAPADALVFFDPDNGFEVPSVVRRTVRSPKHVYWDEVQATADHGRPVVVYQHFARRARDAHLTALLSRSREELPDHVPLGVRGRHGAFIGAAADDHDAAALAAAFEEVARRWSGHMAR